MTSNTGSDSFALGACIAWIVSHLAQIDTVVQIIAGILAGTAALVSLIKHWRIWKQR